MKQAKVLNDKELKVVLAVIGTQRHAARNRALVLVSYLGLRACEIANLKYGDVLTAEGKIKSEVYLQAHQTKGNEGRRFWINTRMQQELAAYIRLFPQANRDYKLFYSQKSHSVGFSPNTIVQLLSRIYQDAGIEGATSHSGRRTFCTRLADCGTSIAVIMKMSGHKHLSSVQRYIEVNEAVVRRAVELV